jgi:hypothetical protein
LSENVNAAQIRIEAVGESDIDDAVHSAESDGGLGAVASERIEALSGAAGKKDSECVFHRHAADFLEAALGFSFERKQ